MLQPGRVRRHAQARGCARHKGSHTRTSKHRHQPAAVRHTRLRQRLAGVGQRACGSTQGSGFLLGCRHAARAALHQAQAHQPWVQVHLPLGHPTTPELGDSLVRSCWSVVVLCVALVGALDPQREAASLGTTVQHRQTVIHTRLPGHPTSATPTPGVSPSWSSRPRVNRKRETSSSRSGRVTRERASASACSCPLLQCLRAAQRRATRPLHKPDS